MKINQKNNMIWAAIGLIILLVVLYRSNINFGQTEKTEITIITKSKYGECWESVAQGVHAAANEYGVIVKVLAPDSDKDVEAQKTLLETAVTNGTDVIIIAPIDYAALDETMEDIRKQGIPIFTMVSLNARYPNDNYIGLDHYNSGKLLGQSLVNQIGDKGSVAILSVSEMNDDDALRENGIRDFIEDYKDIHIIETKENKMSEFTITTSVKDIMKEHADVSAFIGTNEMATRGICNGLKDVISPPVVVGLGNSHDIISHLETQLVDELLVPNYFGIGYMTVKNSVDYMNRKDYEKPLYIEPIPVTVENMYDENVQKVLFTIE